MPSRASQEPPDNWVLRFSALKRVYRLITQYFSDFLGQFTDTLQVPDLQAVAKEYNVPSTLMMCRLTLAIAVQCDKNKEFIEKIQGLSEGDQHCLMKAIEQVQQDSFRPCESFNVVGFRLWLGSGALQAIEVSRIGIRPSK